MTYEDMQLMMFQAGIPDIPEDEESFAMDYVRLCPESGRRWVEADPETREFLLATDGLSYMQRKAGFDL